jgi:hypothetical protein
MKREILFRAQPSEDFRASVKQILTNYLLDKSMPLEDAYQEIAKLLPSSRSGENGVNVELLEAAKYFKHRLDNFDRAEGSEITNYGKYRDVISNYEKQIRT